MKNSSGVKRASGNPQQSYASLVASIAHHDAAIDGLTGRMAGVENGLERLQHDVNDGFRSTQHSVGKAISELSSRFDKMDAAPKFDFHKSVQTLLALSVLLSLVCAGIIYISSNQFSGSIAEQRAVNDSVKGQLANHDERFRHNEERISRTEQDLNSWQVVVRTAKKGSM